MTNNDDKINMTPSIARRLRMLEAERAAYANPILPAVVNRPAPRSRRTSVRHRAIR